MLRRSLFLTIGKLNCSPCLAWSVSCCISGHSRTSHIKCVFIPAAADYKQIPLHQYLLLAAIVHLNNEHCVEPICCCALYVIYVHITGIKLNEWNSNEYRLALRILPSLEPSNKWKEELKLFICLRTLREPFLFQGIAGFIMDAHHERHIKPL